MSMRVLTALWLFSASTAALAQDAAPVNDTVQFRDADGKVVTRIGELRQTPEGLVLVSSGRSTVLSPADVIAVYYANLPGVDDRTRMMFQDWDAKAGPESLQRYSELLATLPRTAADRTRRVLEYKVALTAAAVADSKQDDAALQAALERLNQFVRSHADSWEVWPAAWRAIRLQTEQKLFPHAIANARALVKAPALPANLKVDARLLEAELLFQARSFLDCAIAIQAVEQSAPSAEQLARARLLGAALNAAQNPAQLSRAVQEIRDAINRSTSPDFAAAAHRVLGELWLIANRPAEARWEYLWIEAVHNQNPDDVRFALHRLVAIFEQLGDLERAEIYKEKYRKARGG